MRTLGRFVANASAVRDVLHGERATLEELLLRSELRRRIQQLSTLLGEAADGERNRLRAGACRVVSEIAATLATNNV